MIWQLILNNSKKHYWRTILIIIVLAISLLSSALIWSLYDNIEGFLFQQHWVYEYDYAVEFKDPSSRWWFVNNQNIETTSSTIRQPILDDQTIDKKYIVSSLKLPVQISIGIVGENITSDIIVFSISDDFFGNIWWDTIPVAIGEMMLNLYNTQIADEWILPNIPKTLLPLARITFDFGISTFLQVDDISTSIRLPWKIQKVSGILPMWVVIPESVARSVVADLWKWSINPYKIVVIAKNEEHLTYLIEKYWDKYTTITNFDYINNLREKIHGLKIFFQVLHYSIIAILIWFLIYITFSIVEQNKKIFSVLRLHGISQWKMITILSGQVILYVLWASLLFCLFFGIYHIAGIPYLNTLLSTQYWVDYLLQKPTPSFYVLNIGIHLLLILSLTIIFSYTERSKKFESL